MTLTVLIAEDEPNLALNLQQRLLTLGYEANEVVATRADAVRVAASWKPKIILMDITLENNEDGIETAIEINKTAHIPIIFVTASTDLTLLERAKSANCYGYITKPYNERDIVRAIEIASARSSMQNLVEANERKFRHIFENSADQVFLLDGDCHILDCNSQCFHETGFSVEELKRISIEEIFRLKETTLKRHLTASFSVETIVTAVGDMTCKDSTTFPCEIRVSTVLDANDTLQYIVVARNISERNQVEKEYKDALMQVANTGRLASLGSISSGLIHEMRNPLTSILGFSELLINRPNVSAQISSKLTIIKDAALQMKKCIDHLKVFIQKDDIETMEDLDLNRVINRSLDLMKFQTGTISLNVIEGENLDPILGHMSQIETVIQNLLLNSCDAFESRPFNDKVITIRTYMHGGRVYFDYEDNAGGIASEDVPQVFDPFFGTRNAKVRGTGMGLSVVHYIMERHKGLIHLTVRESHGTRFILSFPQCWNFHGTEYDVHNMIAYKVEKVD